MKQEQSPCHFLKNKSRQKFKGTKIKYVFEKLKSIILFVSFEMNK